MLRERARNKGKPFNSYVYSLGLTAFLTSEYEWLGKMREDTPDVYFLAFPFIKGPTLDKVTPNKLSQEGNSC